MIPMIVALVVSQFKPAYIVGRYEVTVLPAFILLLAGLWLKIKDKIWISLIVILLLFFTFQYTIIFRDNGEAARSSDKTVIEDIYGQAQEGDYVVTTDLNWTTAYYYLNQIDGGRKINLIAFPHQAAEQVVWLNWDEVNNPENMGKYAEEADSLISKIGKIQRLTKFLCYTKKTEPSIKCSGKNSIRISNF